MSAPVRILSDLHYGDKASALRALPQIAPLLADAGEVILNGDTLDTRSGPNPGYNARLRSEVETFVRESPRPIRCLTGNHDPDISAEHAHELAGGRVLLTHGDIAFDDIVPWGRDATEAGKLVARERGGRTDLSLDQLLAAHRRAALAIPQRHQAEANPVRYLAGFLADIAWPPTRVPRILRAWAEMPRRISAVAKTHRPQAKFIVNGHTHRPGVWRRPDGRVVINTGSFCPPSGFQLVDVTADAVRIRRIETRRGDFHPGGTVAEFALAAG